MCFDDTDKYGPSMILTCTDCVASHTVCLYVVFYDISVFCLNTSELFFVFTYSLLKTHVTTIIAMNYGIYRFEIRPLSL